MRFPLRALAAIALAVSPAPALAGAPKAPDAPAAPPDITLTLDTIDVIRKPEAKPAAQPGIGYLSGKAFAHQGELELFDVVFVIDTSGSTADSSGLGNHPAWISRIPGVRVSTADSVLGAEVSAVESMLDQFDPRTTRVGLVSFAGTPNPYEHHAWTDAALTSDYKQIRSALADRLLVPPDGGTDLAAGLLRGAIELLGTRSADSQPRKNTTKHLVVLTDGMPTLPEHDAVFAAKRAARKLAKHDIRVHVFAIGAEAAGEGLEIEPVARVTHGEYHAVADLRNLNPLLKQIEFRSLRALRVQNLTTGGDATQLARDETGEWSALVPFVPGKNQIEVVAVASDGRVQKVEREIVFGKVSLDAEQLARRERLLILQAQAEARARAQAGDKQKALTVQPESPATPAVGAR